jgi:hypothetical protein
MVSYIRACAFIVLTTCALLMTQHAAAKTSALVQARAVGINDSFQLVLTTDQDVSDPPDLSPLQQDFDILTQSKSSSVSIVNGSMTRSTSWVLELMAKREGNLVIPSIVVGNEQTAAVDVTVAATSPAASGAPPSEVDLEIDVDNLSPYVQQQFIFTVRLVHTLQFADASLTEPTVSGGNVIVEKLGDDVAYETTRGGTRVGIVERRYALFAQNSEKIVIEPLRFEGRVSQNRRLGFDPFGRGRIVRKQSDPIEVDVRPIPADFSGTTWLPARQLMLVENSPDGVADYRVGEPLTRTLTLQASGLSASQLPEIDLPVPDGIKQYPDQPTLENRVSENGLVAIRQQKVALIPSQPGKVTLPAVEIPWWNTQTGQQEYARLPGRTIEVLPGTLPSATGTAASQPQSASAGSDDATAEVPDAAQLRPAGAASIWPWLSLLLAIGWLATVLGWLWSRRQPRKELPARHTQPQMKPLLAAIKSACDDNAAEACKAALLQWANLQWPGSNIRSLGALAALLDGELQAQVHQLSQTLYRQRGGDWDGEKFWGIFSAWKMGPGPKTAKPVPQLEPLYR